MSAKLATTDLEVRLASSEDDLRAVQHLRWRVFVEELGASVADPDSRRDVDPYDAVCDHLLVMDRNAQTGQVEVVGTYRLLRQSIAMRHGGLYTASEFDLARLLSWSESVPGELLELGRSCVLPAYRTSHTISLLWRGISRYLAMHRVSCMIGCASFAGTDPQVHANGLSYLAHHHLAPAEQSALPLSGRGVPMEQLPRGSYDERRALLSLPPLIKGYLRAGAMFGEGAFIDHHFGTIDVCVILPVDRMSNRYVSRFNVAA